MTRHAPEDTLVVAIEPLPDADREERAELARNLTSELEDQRLGDVRMLEADDELPEGAKGDPLEIVGLVVSVITAIPTVVEFLRSWRARAGVPKIHVRRGDESLTIAGGTAEEQARLLETWLRRSG